MHLPGVR